MKIPKEIRNLLPFGYLFLVSLGILKESVFYYFLNVNYLQHASITDVLISPIADLMSHPLIICAVGLYLWFVYSRNLYLFKNRGKENLKKWFGKKVYPANISEEDAQKRLYKDNVKGFVFGLFSFYIGMGLGGGFAVSQRIAKDDLKIRNKIIFLDGEVKEIQLIGSNTENYFYVEKGNKNVQISPVKAVKTLEYIKKEKSKRSLSQEL